VGSQRLTAWAMARPLYLGWSSDCWLFGCCSNLTDFLSKSTLLSSSSRAGARTPSAQRWLTLLRNPTIRSLFVVAGNAIWAVA
jgi:hypothetical protein